ncbi:MAG: YchJ family metal-binding protein [Legionellaceae bacterium]|nr:YchJ family metal-binding protein [Legionellaceae bacterium]
MSHCPCGFGVEYSLCCEPYLLGSKLPQSPEALMRSRYTAYSKAKIDYIKRTMKDKASVGFQEEGAKKWANRVRWVGLHLHKTFQESPSKGFVEFTATYVDGEKLQLMHELSEFRYEGGQWFYVDGTPLETQRTSPVSRIARNTPCPCGSQKKFKNCHGI